MTRLLSILLLLAHSAVASTAPMPPESLDVVQWLTWDQEGEAVAWNVFTNDVAFAQVTVNRVELPDFPYGVTKITVSAIGITGLESVASAAYFLTNAAPLTNVIVTLIARLTLTNPPAAQMFFALCESTNLATWKPTAAAIQISKEHF
jgi:hypothetical protein